MLQALNPNVAECLARAKEAERRAAECRDPTAKADFASIAVRWVRLAESYQFIERVEQFIKTTKR